MPFCIRNEITDMIAGRLEIILGVFQDVFPPYQKKLEIESGTRAIERKIWRQKQRKDTAISQRK